MEGGENRDEPLIIDRLTRGIYGAKYCFHRSSICVYIRRRAYVYICNDNLSTVARDRR